MIVTIDLYRPSYTRNARNIKVRGADTPVLTGVMVTMTSTKNYRTDQRRMEDNDSAGVETRVEQLIVIEQQNLPQILNDDMIKARDGQYKGIEMVVIETRPYDSETQLVVRSYQ